MKDKDSTYADTTIIHVTDGLNNILNATESQAQEKPAALLSIGGPSNGTLFDLVGDKMMVGRSHVNNISIALNGISRRHFLLSCPASNDWYVEDCGSKNGTYLNNKLIERKTRLNKGDVIKLLDIAFKYLPKGDSERLAYDELKLAAHTDGHTGCFNKVYFNQKLEEYVRSAHQHNNKLTLLVFDLDHFKQLNDKYGHHAGDYVLQKIAELVRVHVLRDEDIFARYGGEEFVIILPNTNLDTGCAIAEDIRQLIERHHFLYEERSILVTASLGVSELNRTILTGTDLFKNADKATYNAKKLGRNRVATF